MRMFCEGVAVQKFTWGPPGASHDPSQFINGIKFVSLKKLIVFCKIVNLESHESKCLRRFDKLKNLNTD